MAFSVAMNSKRANAIVALLIASNFAEIKGVVFKRFDARRLLILSCMVSPLSSVTLGRPTHGPKQRSLDRYLHGISVRTKLDGQLATCCRGHPSFAMNFTHCYRLLSMRSTG